MGRIRYPLGNILALYCRSEFIMLDWKGLSSVIRDLKPVSSREAIVGSCKYDSVPRLCLYQAYKGSCSTIVYTRINCGDKYWIKQIRVVKCPLDHEKGRNRLLEVRLHIHSRNGKHASESPSIFRAFLIHSYQWFAASAAASSLFASDSHSRARTRISSVSWASSHWSWIISMMLAIAFW